MATKRPARIFLPALIAACCLAIFPGGSVLAAATGSIPFTQPPFSTTCDANHDGVVDGQDVTVLKLYWKGFPVPDIDCTYDGSIDARDLAVLMGEWTGAVPVTDAQAMWAMETRSASADGYQLALPASFDDRVGERVTVLLILSASGNPIGAGEAAIGFDPTRVTVHAVRTSPSLWTEWAERPKPPYGSRLVFAGGRPHGFSGTGIVAEMDFDVIAPGNPDFHIEDSSRAFRPDAAGTPINLFSDQAPSLSYEGSAPSPQAAELRARTVTLVPVHAPTPESPVWAVDLSSLADPGETASYEIDDGVSHAVQLEDVYVLSRAAIDNRGFRVTVHSASGFKADWQVNLAWPGTSTAGELWSRFASWILIEVAAALVLAILLFRRR